MATLKSAEDLSPTSYDMQLHIPGNPDEKIYFDEEETIPVTLKIGGIYTKQYKDAMRKYLMKTENNQQFDEDGNPKELSEEEKIEKMEQNEKDEAELLSAAVLDWSPKEFWGGDFSTEKLAEILKEPKNSFIHLQIWEVLKNNKNFFRGNTGKDKESNNTQS